MKAFISFFLIFSHLFSTVGFSMEIHECGGKKTYSLYGIHIAGSCDCNHEDAKHSKDCCSDKHTVVKAVQSDKQVVKVLISKNFIEPFIFSKPTEFVNTDVTFNGRNTLAFGAKHPPDHSPPLYILYNVFLI